MRHRRGLSQEQVAAHLRVHPTTVCYWEQSRTTPPADRLDELFTLLCAHPEERAALADGRLFLAPPLQETAPTLEALEQTLLTLDARAHRGERAGLDLGFLALEARLWPLAQRHPSALFQLVRAWSEHAEWLTWYDRRREAWDCANRVLETARQGLVSRSSQWSPVAQSLHVAALVTGRGSGRGAPAQAVELLQHWLTYDPRSGWETVLCREMADYAVESRHIEAAWEFSVSARAAAERTGVARLIRISKDVQANVLMGMGRYGEALSLLPLDDDPVAISRVQEALRWAEALLALGEMDDAIRCLDRAHALIANATTRAFSRGWIGWRSSCKPGRLTAGNGCRRASRRWRCRRGRRRRGR